MNRIIYDEKKEYEIAHPLKRFLAFVIDSFLIVPIYLILIYILDIFSLDLNLNMLLIKNFLYNPLFLIFIFVTWIIFKGQSIGQIIMNIKIESMDKKDITFIQYFLRLIGWLASNITFGIGFLVMFFNKDRRTLHDLTSKCKVIDLKKERI